MGNLSAVFVAYEYCQYCTVDLVKEEPKAEGGGQKPGTCVDGTGAWG